MNTGPDNPSEDTPLRFPCAFPIKVMGLNVEHFVHAITTIAKTHDPLFDAATIALRASTGGKYLGVTITVNATSREQLDALYRALTSHELVRYVI